MSFADLLTLVANQISCRSSILLHDAVGSYLLDMYFVQLHHTNFPYHSI
jgi:hypothetical protein